MSFYTKNLRDDEQIIAIIRRNWLISLPKYILAFILFFIPFFFMFPLLNWNIFGQVFFAILLAVAFFYLLKLISMAYFNCLLITTQRLIDFSQTKIFERQIKEIDFADISEVSYKFKGILQNLFHSANLEIKLRTSADGPPLIIKHISQPEKVQNLILDLKKLDEEEKNIKNKQNQTAETYQEILKKIKKDIGKEGLERLIRSLDLDEDESKAERGEKNNLEFLK